MCLPASALSVSGRWRRPGSSSRAWQLAWVTLALLVTLRPAAAQSVWAAVAQSATTNDLRGIAYGNGLYVAVGDAGAIVTSPDAANWTAQTSGTSVKLTAVAFGEGAFVAVGDNVILHSGDGIAWAASDGVFPRMGAVVYGGGQFVAVGGIPLIGVPNILTSPDGVTWTGRQTEYLALDRLIYGNGRFITMEGQIYSSSAPRAILSSTDGVTWTKTYISTSRFGGVGGVGFRGGLFLAFINDSLWSSADGLTWDAKPTGYADPSTLLTSPEVIVGAETRTGRLITSEDGSLWTLRDLGATAATYGGVFGGNRFVLVGAGGSVVTHDANAQLPAPALISWKEAAVSSDEIAGTATLTIQRSGPTDSVATVGYNLGDAVFAPGESETTVPVHFPYDPARTADRLQLYITLLLPPLDHAILPPSIATVTVLDHEASVRFSSARDLSGDFDGHLTGTLHIENVGDAASGPLRVRMIAVPISYGPPFPEGFDPSERPVGEALPIAGLTAGGSTEWAFSSFSPLPFSTISWIIFGRIDERVGNTWVALDQWQLFQWPQPTSGGPPIRPQGNGGAVLSSTSVQVGAGATIPPVAVEVKVTGPTALTGGRTGSYLATARLSNGTKLATAPAWTTTLGTISSAGRLTFPSVNQPETATVTASFQFNGRAHAAQRAVRVLPLRAPVITSAASAIATRGIHFRYQIVAKNFPTEFDASGLPEGLVLDRATGVIAGGATEVGAFTVALSAANAAGHDTLSLSLPVFDSAPLNVTATGRGTLSAPFPGTDFWQVGRRYTVTAHPAAGALFTGWSGGLTATSPTLAFMMPASLTLQAHFIENPFASHRGVYAGVIHAFPETQEASGLIRLELNGAGSFTGRVSYGGASYPTSGHFNALGALEDGRVTRPGKTPLLLSLQFTAGPPATIRGTLSDGVARPSVAADPLLTTAAGFEGRYTAAPGAIYQDGPKLPLASGASQFRVNADGTARLMATLPDGATVSWGGAVTSVFQMPFYAPLYHGRGALAGSIDLANLSHNANDALHWFRPPLPGLFPEGWPSGVPASFPVSRFDPAAAFLPGLAAPSPAGNAQLRLNFGQAQRVYDVNIDPTGSITGFPPDDGLFQLKIDPETGLFQGSFRDGTAAAGFTTRPILGALLQGDSRGAGFYLGPDQSEGVSLFAK
jgi:hypothetical protein